MFCNNQLFPIKSVELFPKKSIDEWMNQGEEFNFKKGEVITRFGHLKNKVYLIKKGSVSVFHIHVDGKECIIGLLSSGEFINLFDVFTEKESSMVFKALTEVTVVAIQKEKVRETVRETPTLAMEMLSHFSCKLQEMVEVLAQVAYGKVEERLLFLFKKFAVPMNAENGWCPLSCAITHQDLAGMVGSTRETVTVLINKLIQFGIIRQYEDRIWIKLESLDQD
ncbi:Crp/Fnr family transcriptional regulator [Oceanirhabdus seepicola]|uniref:Crp/Fnr family transcriptional regulator n=1 Tax=Oceanirhabdus seepicola TaxID=2828781 RepID=A0A9J6NY88_9CLOT|nr:Crp/Fnr family transcriptional regulator [Oceanirhabdus seepicola]MCM1989487.1 Crp/Fnr family transcriptional regulator [Oceanirhabdus seepicola]